MTNNLDIQFEKAIRLLTQHMPISDENTRKPVIFHDIRVGVYLYNNGYSENIVMAGILHDTIEWSDITEKMLKREFGDKITELVLANSKDSTIEKEKRNEDMVKRCVQTGMDALIIKTADILDSFHYYSKINNIEQLKNHCLVVAKLILDNKPLEWNDKIFGQLQLEYDALREKINSEIIQ